MRQYPIPRVPPGYYGYPGDHVQFSRYPVRIGRVPGTTWSEPASTRVAEPEGL